MPGCSAFAMSLLKIVKVFGVLASLELVSLPAALVGPKVISKTKASLDPIPAIRHG